MARYIGPKERINRRFGTPLFGESKVLERRNFPPGQHGARFARKKKSDYGISLEEKQKLRFQYDIVEKQFRSYYQKATKSKGVTGDVLLQLLELRLDNVCYRLGFGKTRSAARQLVNHGHVLVNGVRTDIPSFSCKPGDVITISNRDSSRQLVTSSLDKTQGVPLKNWLIIDKEKLSGTVARTPEAEDMDANVNIQLVVEFYSR